MIVTIPLTALWLAWTTQPCAASRAPMQLAQRSTDLLQLGKDMLGMGEQTPEGQASTGITNGVPFLVRFRDTVKRHREVTPWRHEELTPWVGATEGLSR
jgi:hypothetical protein